MPVPVPPLGRADLPERKHSVLKLLGPGIVLAGIGIGSGEMVMWPWITSVVGPSLIWAAAIGIFLQLWINIEVGRWAVVTGESPFTGMVRVVSLMVYMWVAIVLVGKFLPGWARETGVALRNLLFGVDNTSPDWLWTALVFAVVGIILFGPKVVYVAVERVIMVLIAIIVLGLVYVVWEIGTPQVWGQMWRGLISFGQLPDFPVNVYDEAGAVRDQLTFNRFFGAMVFVGLGGLGNLYYAYYLREKKIGMGERMPSLMSATHKHEVKEIDTGFVYEDTPENVRRFKSWMRYVHIDQVFTFWILGSFTLFLFVFGALAVLYPNGLVPKQSSLVWDLASILEQSMGVQGRYLFLVVGMAALFSTQLGAVDGGSRIFSDLIHTNFKFGRIFSLERWYLILVIGTMVIGTGSVWYFGKFGASGLDFLFLNALIGGFAMAVYVPTLLYMNLTHLPKSARPGPVNIVFMVLASLLYISFAVYTIVDKVGGLLGG